MNQEKTIEKVIDELLEFQVVLPGYKGIMARYFAMVYSIGYNTGIRSVSNQKAVLQLNHFGEVLDRFESASQAARIVKGNKSNIAKVCNGKTHSAYGFLWRWE